MKAILSCCLMIAMIIGGCTREKSSEIEGAWKVVSWQNISMDTIKWELGKDYTGSEMKIWSKDHFVFAGRYKQDTTYIDNGGGGSYKINDTHYEETYLYFPDQKIVGTSQKLLLEIKNDTLIQTWPVDDNWQVIKSNYNIQKLIRLR